MIDFKLRCGLKSPAQPIVVGDQCQLLLLSIAIVGHRLHHHESLGAAPTLTIENQFFFTIITWKNVSFILFFEGRRIYFVYEAKGNNCRCWTILICSNVSRDWDKAMGQFALHSQIFSYIFVTILFYIYQMFTLNQMCDSYTIGITLYLFNVWNSLSVCVCVCVHFDSLKKDHHCIKRKLIYFCVFVIVTPETTNIIRMVALVACPLFSSKESEREGTFIEVPETRIPFASSSAFSTTWSFSIFPHWSSHVIINVSLHTMFQSNHGWPIDKFLSIGNQSIELHQTEKIYNSIYWRGRGGERGWGRLKQAVHTISIDTVIWWHQFW